MKPHGLAPPIVAGLPTRSRVLIAIRWLYRRDGLCPSHSQIAQVAGIAEKRVRIYVAQLSAEGVLTYQAGKRRSILLVDRAAMLSDDEFRLGAAGRGMVISDSPLPELAAAFPIEEGVANWGLKLLAEIDDKAGTSPLSGDEPGVGNGEGEAQSAAAASIGGAGSIG